jgi:cobalamin synthase
MLFSGMLCHVALVRTNILEERISSIIRAKRIGEIGTMLAVILCSMLQLLVTANVLNSVILFTLMMEVTHSSKASGLTRATWHNIPDDGILL